MENININHIAALSVSFISTLFFIYFCYNFAVSIQLTDRPDWRKEHKGEIPLIGGIGVIFGFSLGCLISFRGMSEWRPFFVCMFPLMLIGIMDDHGDISVRKRIIVQILTCFIMFFYGKIKLYSFGDIIGIGYTISFEELGFIVTLICVIGVINALNLIDGIDGLCASISIIACISVVVVVITTGATASIALILYFSAALMAFLLINLGFGGNVIKKVFLGDAGTTIIGFFLCWHLIKLSQGENAIIRPIFSVWILIVPIMDTLSVIVRRIRNGDMPFKPGRDHIHHILLGLGLSQKMVLLVLVILSFTLAAVATICEIKKLPEAYMFYAAILLFGLYHLLSEKLYKNQSITKNH